ncbi:hypothetical protein B0I72DRAFT_133607 [Yarrowia lipolytica]|uniref:Uncharacterized protein n=1 Tax=Yarrowia lipolytica TaxID=4952 RepID=A0A371C260_YARLL|nr:hypothetical protein B0I71DRAFT_134325 [Yarrowia lipolytica]RDW35105.1 hypothetical protein B0I72DRAFT_133607 [Yarrowia lipolytica]
MGYSLTTPTPIVITNLIPCLGFPQQVIKKASSISTLNLDFEPLFEDGRLLIGDQEDSYPAAEFVIPRFSLTSNNFLNASYPWREPSGVVEVKQERDHLSNLLALGTGYRVYDGHRKRFYVCHDRFGRCILVHNKNLHSAFEFNLHNQQIVHVAILPSTTVIHVSSEEGVIEALIVDLAKKRLIKILSFIYFNPATCGVFQFGEVLWFSFGGVSIRVEVDWNTNLECLHGNVFLGRCSWSVGPSLGVFPMQGTGACLKYVGCIQDRTRVFDLETETMIIYKREVHEQHILRGTRNGQFGFWVVNGSVSQTLQKLWLHNSKTGKTPDQWLLEAGS